MAKMFYTLEEAAEKLGVSIEEIKEMAVAGKLQQFRDREKLMFKREQVDAMGHGAKGDTAELIPLNDSGDTDAIDLADSGLSKSSLTGQDSRHKTGVSVFDTSEIEAVDPLAQTQVTGGLAEQAELSLESVGSGSGLLDLTRESDDTSLGAELLDEIYPGGEGSDAKMESAIGSSGVFESAVGLDAGAMAEGVPTGEIAAMGAVSYGEGSDPASNGLGIGMLLGASIALVIALIVAVSLVGGVASDLTTKLAKDTNTLYLWTGILLGASFVMGGIGFFLGRAANK